MDTNANIINKMLKTIKQDASFAVMAQFLISELEENIRFHARNSLYWNNQLSHMKNFEKYENEEAKKKALQPYKRMLKENKKNIKCFKKSIKSLQKAIKHTNKGEHVHV